MGEVKRGWTKCFQWSRMGNIENKGVRVLRVSGKESGRSDITIGFFFETEGEAEGGGVRILVDSFE